MKLQQTPTPKLNINAQHEQKRNTSQPKFTGAEVLSPFLMFLETNQAWGATAIDLSSMVIPRTAVDFTRGRDAGIETGRREAASTINTSLIGAYGLAAAGIFAHNVSKRFDIKANKMFFNDKMLEILGQTNIEHGNIKTSENNLNNYLNEIFGNARGFNPLFEDEKLIDKKGWVGLDNATQEKVIKKLTEELKSGTEKISEETKAYLKAIIGVSTGASGKFKIEKTVNGKPEMVVSSLDDFIENVYKISKAFMNDKVAQTFNAKNIDQNIFIKAMKKLNAKTSILGLAIASLIGISAQPFNMYLTKKKTGKEGFVGVEGREPDKSNGFKILKTAIATTVALGVLAAIGKNPSEIFRKVQFKGIIPVIDQFKLVYGMTIVSRLFSARDKNELRESSIKDSLGFANWFILGGFVSKLVAAGVEKLDKFKGEKFIRYNEAENGKGWFNWLTKSSITSYEEALHTGLKKAGISTIKAGGLAKTFKEMLKEAPEATKTKIKYLQVIQLAGYLYSGLVLGLGIPKLNIAITNAMEKKNKKVSPQK